MVAFKISQKGSAETSSENKADNFFSSISWTLKFVWPQQLDHCSIYLLIAGTYTPILTIVIPGTISRLILLTVWIMAAVGIVFKIFFIGRFKKISIGFYLAMGWLSVLLINKIFQNLGFSGISLILAGGVAYSAGVVFYINKRIPFNHALWHCFVIVGAFIHFYFIAKNVKLVI